MLVKVTVLAAGHGPSEQLIGVRTAGGDLEQVIVSRRVLRGSAIEVGQALVQEGGNILVELPRESTSGKWRIWVPESEIDHNLQAAE